MENQDLGFSQDTNDLISQSIKKKKDSHHPFARSDDIISKG